MSGGRWGYQADRLREQAKSMTKILEAVAESEHIIDWATSGDTSIEGAQVKLFELWEQTFESLYDE